MDSVPWSLRRLGVLTLLLLLPALVWDASGLDLPLARLSGSTAGFAWRDQAVWVLLLHEVPRWLNRLALLLLMSGALRPWGGFRVLARCDRWQLVASVVLAMALVALLKRTSHSSCPWDLAEFGGTASYVSHWQWGLRDQGPGHCFPAGHASNAFGFMAGWFVLRRAAPRWAWCWLVVALLAGLLLGWAQQLRGAHYLSHTLWSAWVCWATGWAVEVTCTAWMGRNGRRTPGPVPQLNES